MAMKEIQSLLINCIYKDILPRTPAGGCTDLPATGLVWALLCNREFPYGLGYFSGSIQAPQMPEHWQFRSEDQMMRKAWLKLWCLVKKEHRVTLLPDFLNLWINTIIWEYISYKKYHQHEPDSDKQGSSWKTMQRSKLNQHISASIYFNLKPPEGLLLDVQIFGMNQFKPLEHTQLRITYYLGMWKLLDHVFQHCTELCTPRAVTDKSPAIWIFGVYRKEILQRNTAFSIKHTIFGSVAQATFISFAAVQFNVFYCRDIYS